jgi:hypothetical protein
MWPRLSKEVNGLAISSRGNFGYTQPVGLSVTRRIRIAELSLRFEDARNSLRGIACKPQRLRESR